MNKNNNIVNKDLADLVSDETKVINSNVDGTKVVNSDETKVFDDSETEVFTPLMQQQRLASDHNDSKPTENVENSSISNSEQKVSADGDYSVKDFTNFLVKVADGLKNVTIKGYKWCEDNVFWRVRQSATRACENTKYACQRAFRGYDDLQVWNFGFSEIRLLAKKLRCLESTAHGSPINYDDENNWLMPRDENWESTIAPSRAMSLKEQEPDYDADKFDHVLQVKDCGRNFCAWLEDLDYAADVLDEYAEMCDNIRGYDTIVIYGREEYDRRMKLIQEKFDTVWAWIGKNIPNLWD